MDLSEAQKLIKSIVDKDLPLQQFANEQFAKRAAEAYTLVLSSEYVAFKDGYAWRVKPKEGMYILTKRKEKENERHSDLRQTTRKVSGSGGDCEG